MFAKQQIMPTGHLVVVSYSYDPGVAVGTHFDNEPINGRLRLV